MGAKPTGVSDSVAVVEGSCSPTRFRCLLKFQRLYTDIYLYKCISDTIYTLSGATILASGCPLDQRIPNYCCLSGGEVEFVPSGLGLVCFNGRRISEHREETDVVVVVVHTVAGDKISVEGMHIVRGNHLEEIGIR